MRARKSLIFISESPLVDTLIQSVTTPEIPQGIPSGHILRQGRTPHPFLKPYCQLSGSGYITTPDTAINTQRQYRREFAYFSGGQKKPRRSGAKGRGENAPEGMRFTC